VLYVRSTKSPRSLVCSEQENYPRISTYIFRSRPCRNIQQTNNTNCNSNQYLAHCSAGAPRSCGPRLCGAAEPQYVYRPGVFYRRPTAVFVNNRPRVRPLTPSYFVGPAVPPFVVPPATAPLAALPVVTG